METNLTRFRGGGCSMFPLAYKHFYIVRLFKLSENIVGEVEMDDHIDYDPYLQRQGLHMTTNLETFVHLVKSSMGTGLLAMPRAFAHAGTLVGSIGSFLVGIFCCYGIHLMIHSLYRVCKVQQVSTIPYGEGMKGALEMGPPWLRFSSKPSVYFVEFILVVYQIGICCVYIVFVSDNMKKMVDHWSEEKISLNWYITGCAAILMLLNQIRNLKLLAPVSAVSNIFMFVGLFFIFYYVFTDMPPFNSRPLGVSIDKLPSFISTMLFALESVGVVISLENNMKTPRSFTGLFGILNAGFTVVVLLYWFMGLFGFIKYGDEVRSVITMNLPVEDWEAQFVVVVYAIAIFLSYPLQVYPAQEIIWGKYMSPKCCPPEDKLYWIWETLFRIGVVLITYAVAIAVPKVGVIIDFLGAFCLSTLGICFPALMDMCTLYPDEYGRLQWILIKDVVMFVLGFAALTVGLYSWGRDLHE